MSDPTTTPSTHLPPPPLPPPPGTPGNRGERPPPAEPPRPARRSRAWLIAGSVLLVPVLVWGVLQAVFQLAHSEETVAETVAADGITTIVVRNPTGLVEVVGDDVEEVTIRAEVSHGLRRTGFGHDVDGDRLEVWGTCPLIGSSWCEVKYRIQVPTDMSVEVRSADRATVRNVSGTVDARISNGSVATSGLSGPAVLHSTNGSVRVEDHRGRELDVTTTNGDLAVDFREPPDMVTARSTNGDVLVVLPPDDEIRYSVTVESNNGTRTNEVVTDPNSDREVTARTNNGDATVRYP